MLAARTLRRRPEPSRRTHKSPLPTSPSTVPTCHVQKSNVNIVSWNTSRHSYIQVMAHVITKEVIGLALVSRIVKIIRLFCKRARQKRQYSAKETYN